MHEARHEAADLVRRDAAPRAYRRRGLEGKSAREDRSAAEHGALLVRQQVIAPVHRRAERVVPRQVGAARVGQEAKAIVEPIGDLIDRQGLEPRGGELDRQRDAVETAADPRQSRGVLRRHRKRGINRGRALRKQPHRLARHQGRPGRHDGRRRHREGGDVKRLLLRHGQRLAARCQDAHGRARFEDRANEVRGGGADVFATVEDQQEMFRGGERGQGFEQRLPWFFRDSEDRGGGLHDEAWIGERRELHEPHAVGIRVEQTGGDLQRKPCLPAAADGGEGEQPRGTEQTCHLGDLVLAADEARGLRRQVVHRRVPPNMVLHHSCTERPAGKRRSSKPPAA
mgnify:CR=1 FL=1